MREIFKFLNNDIEYSLLINNESLVYQKKESDNISNDLSLDEKKLVDDILISILPSKNIIDLGNIKFANSKIKHLYDIEKDFHIFSENNKITNNCITLSQIFNNQVNYYQTMKRSEKRDNTYTKRIIKREKVAFKVLISASVLTTLLFFHTIGTEVISPAIKRYSYNKKVEMYKNTALNLFDIISAIDSNPNLTEEEKKFFSSHMEFFDDNLSYFDYYTVINNLKNFKIEYVNHSSKEGIDGEVIDTEIGKPTIVIYNSIGFENTEKCVLTHEFIHLFTKISAYNDQIYEGINTLMNNEYFNDNDEVLYDDSYQSIRNYIYVLAELIDTSVLRKYHANNDIRYLVDELVKIIPDEEMAYQLLDYITFISKADKIYNIDNKAYEDLKEELKFRHTEVRNTLMAYYQKKYEISLEDDLYAYYMINPPAAATKLACELDFDIHTLLYINRYTGIKNFKKVFNKTGNDSLILSLCNGLRELPYYYTKEELLIGNEEYQFDSEEEITLPLIDTNKYLGVIYKPIHYIDCTVLSQDEKNKIDGINR